MQNYKPCLFLTDSDKGKFRDSQEWNIYVKSIPFKVFPDRKDIASRDWPDENGDDEFIPETPVFKAYEIDCEFVFIGTHGTANTSITNFISYLANAGNFTIFDSYTQIGRQRVRYVSYSEKIFYRRDGENDIVVFSLKLKVNDPISNIYVNT